MRKVFEKKVVDYQTGEVQSETSVFVGKLSERFGLYRITDGLSWVMMFDIHEMRLLMLLGEAEDNENHIVTLTPAKRDAISTFMGYTKRHFYRILSRLVERHAVVKLTNFEYLLNPSFFYKGSSAKLIGRIKSFYEIYNKVYGTNISYLDDEVYLPGVSSGFSTRDETFTPAGQKIIDDAGKDSPLHGEECISQTPVNEEVKDEK
jgi:hypothetical protein